MTGSTASQEAKSEVKADLPTVIKILEGMSHKFDEVDSRITAIEGRTGNVSIQSLIPQVQGQPGQAAPAPAGNPLGQAFASNPALMGELLNRFLGPKTTPMDAFQKQMTQFAQMAQIVDVIRGRNVIEEILLRESLRNIMRGGGFSREEREKVTQELAGREAASEKLSKLGAGIGGETE